MLLTNDFNKRLVADLVFETQAMEYEDSVKLFAIEKDVFDRLKSGALTAEACMEQKIMTFTLAREQITTISQSTARRTSMAI